ncbi:MAG TPA: ABC transporter ATP-binding protein [Thermoplasmata archaeon]|jgi:ABC-type multidrug transport system ATPase subunit|nr:MAG TPA: ABC transporter ATP-binding protein [Thermoplasmata archaeon]
MPTQLVKCPTCKTTITISGEPGEKINLTCPQCNQKGVFTVPKDINGRTMASSSTAIDVKGLIKTYNHFSAVNNVSFSVKKGEIFGFLGPNGAGKTTTIKSILDLTHADSGTITINGINVQTHGKEAKKYIGYMPEKVSFYDNLTALQNLSFYAEIKHASKEECIHLIEELGLGDAGKKRVGKFSKGMVQRLGMARAILGSPPILILDEPSGGLDPRGVVLIRDKILEMKKKGTTIFVSSHILSEIQEICDRVGIINKGVLVAQDTVEGLSKKLNLKPQITVTIDAMSTKVENAVKTLPGVDSVKTHGNTLEIICDGAMKAKVILAISTAGGNIQNIQSKEPSLEDVFMRYTEA